MKLESCRNHCAEEIETIITMTGNGSEGFRVYTTSNSILTKIGKFLDDENSPWSIEKIVHHSDGTPSGYFFKCSVKNCFQLKARKLPTKELTPKEKATLSERLKLARENKA